MTEMPVPPAEPTRNFRVYSCLFVSPDKIRDTVESLFIKAAAFGIRVKEHADIWREALAADRARPKLSPMNQAELAFLPAALEVAESPANPAARVVAATLGGAFLFAVVWASVGEIDIVASAPGKIIPSERVKSIQPLETAIIRAIAVKDGQEVKQGDTLVVLEITGAGADVVRLQAENLTARADVARLTALLQPDPAKALRLPADLSSSLAEMHRSLLSSALAEHKAHLAGLSAELAKRQAELVTNRTDLKRLSKVEGKIADETARRQELATKGYGSQIDRLRVEKELAENQGQQQVLRAKTTEAEAAIVALQSQVNQAREEFRKDVTTQLAEAQTKAASTEQELAKAADRQKVQTLTAPVDGVVQQIEVHTVGGVVTPAQKLMSLVPKGAVLEVEAKLPNKDIGFVEEGQAAEIKVDAFPFTRYGTLPAKVETVSLDAVRDEKEQDKEYTFPIRLSLPQAAITIENGKRIPLTPGMSVAAEIKTGTRAPIDYILAPLKKYGAESGRER